MYKSVASALISVLVLNSAIAQEIAKERWISNMKILLPTYFCEETQYFRQCFNVTPAECESTTSSTARLCLDKIGDQIPNILADPQDAKLWGNKVGFCVGRTYESALLKQRIANDRCNNIDNWQ